ncbi:unnamed protein product [Tetraodon nigroviridis]|uniref:Olfactory receptor n=1 Tax=Tetraodon nigroviridis TaxID=99883 RepID=Q4SB33_TETNG|nr:odorant receptor [Tetraodon nigroviridis]CAG02149.1 unnamed protein product [Tetraodon nigroviridis]
MWNGSDVLLVLQGLNASRGQRQVYFGLALSAYLLTILINLLLVLTVWLHRSLHKPIYIFLCNLCLNGMCGASSFYPKLLRDLLAEAQVVTHGGCLAQLFGIYCYVFCEFTSLTVMAYDRYLAICRPLQYGSVMTVQKVLQLLLLTWSFSLLETAVGTFLTARLPLCRHRLPKIFCTNWEVVKLSCLGANTTVNSIYGLILTISHLSQTTLILVSYTHLVRASMKLRSNRRKFMQTCVPHLLALLVFTISLLFDIMYSRYGGSSSSSTLAVLQNALAAEFLVVPPIINPIIYGINLHQIRTKILQHLRPREEPQKPPARS